MKSVDFACAVGLLEAKSYLGSLCDYLCVNGHCLDVHLSEEEMLELPVLAVE